MYFWIVLVCIFKKTHWPFFWSESIETKNLCWQYLKLISLIVSGAHPAKDLHVFVKPFMLMFFCFWPLPVLHSRRCKFIPTTENKLFFRKIRNNVEIEIEKTWFKFVSICVSTLSICIVLVKEWSICIFYWARNWIFW